MKGIMDADVYYSSVGIGRDGGKEKDRELEASDKGSSGPRTEGRLPAAMPGPGKDQATR